MLVKNPDYIHVESAEQAAMKAKEADLRAWFAANTDKESVTFDQIRAKYNKTANQWPDGLIHQKLKEFGFEVVSD